MYQNLDIRGIICYGKIANSINYLFNMCPAFYTETCSVVSEAYLY